MRLHFIRPAAWLLAGALSCAAIAAPKAPSYGNNANGTNKQKEPVKPDPVVIKFQSAQRGRAMGYDVMIISGTEVLSGKARQFAVENDAPTDNKAPKYSPRENIADVVKGMKPGPFLKVDAKEGNQAIPWIDKLEEFKPADHEEEPGVFILFDSYKETVEGTEVYKITLTKFAKYFDCYAPMVSDAATKGKVPDPEIVKAADALKKKEIVEATISSQGKGLFVTSIDAYVAPQQGTFTKLSDADVGGQKGSAADVELDGKSQSLLIPGKLVGKKWVSDAQILTELRKIKPGSTVTFRTRDVDGKTFLRQIAAVPKEPTKAGKPSAAKGADPDMSKAVDGKGK